MSSRQPRKKHVKSSAMQQRIAHLESKLSKKLVAHASRAKSRSNMRPSGMSARGVVGRPTRGGIQNNNRKSSRLISQVTPIPYREECLGPISTSVAFALQSFILNPGNSITFPWLAGIASRYEYYRFKKLSLKLVSTSANAVGSTNTALGSILLNTNYDVLDPTFASQEEMEGYGGGKLHSEAAPDKNQVHHIEANGIKGGVASGWRYVLLSAATTAATQPYPASSSAHDYDIGLMQAASVGVQAASVAGRLYVCYEVELATPKLVPGSPLGATAHFSSIAPTTANNFAGAVLQSGATLGGVTLGTNIVNFPANVPGNYFIQMNVAGSTSGSALAASATTGSVLNILTQGGVRDINNAASSLGGTTTAVSSLTQCLTVPALGCTYTISPSTLVGGNTMDLFIFAMPSTILSVDQYEQCEIDQLKQSISSLMDQNKKIMSMFNSSTNSNLNNSSSSGGLSVIQDDISPVYEDVSGTLRVDTSYGPSSLPPGVFVNRTLRR